jgi:hypothetical protein
MFYFHIMQQVACIAVALDLRNMRELNVAHGNQHLLLPSLGVTNRLQRLHATLDKPFCCI